MLSGAPITPHHWTTEALRGIFTYAPCNTHLPIPPPPPPPGGGSSRPIAAPQINMPDSTFQTVKALPDLVKDDPNKSAVRLPFNPIWDPFRTSFFGVLGLMERLYQNAC